MTVGVGMWLDGSIDEVRGRCPSTPPHPRLFLPHRPTTPDPYASIIDTQSLEFIPCVLGPVAIDILLGGGVASSQHR